MMNGNTGGAGTFGDSTMSMNTMTGDMNGNIGMTEGMNTTGGNGMGMDGSMGGNNGENMGGSMTMG
jgi:hypothetical protein